MHIPISNMTTPPTAPIPIIRGSVNKQYQSSVKSNHKFQHGRLWKRGSMIKSYQSSLKCYHNILKIEYKGNRKLCKSSK